MGWRVTWYKADKENPVSIIHDADEDYDDIKINGEEILYDHGTDIWCDLSFNNEEFKKEIKCLYEHPDCDYFSITKEGFKMMILGYREKTITYLKKQIEVYKNPELKDSRDYWRYDGDLLKILEHDLRIWEWNYPSDDGDRRYENICLHKSKNEFGISGSWSYQYGIFDMIEVYKYFDWDNYTMVVYGG